MKLLIIDDEKSIRLSLQVGLNKTGVKIFTAASGEEGLSIFHEIKPDIAIIDIKLPGIDGIEVLRRIRKENQNCIIIMITYISEVRLAVEAMKLGANDYFTKPFNIEEIKDTIENNLKYIRMKKELIQDKYENFTEIIGVSEQIHEIKKIVDKVTNLSYNTYILIQGESGTGKEIIARAIHYNGIRKNKPYVALNCAAIPQNLQESELFGYEKGAFTEAKTSKKGLIEEAHGGTLFLDEIGDMDILLQAKLLRVLQEKKFRRLGGVKEIEFNANIIAATNKNLLQEIQNGAFREDLYYRLNVVPIYTVPLRERTEDIPVLIDSFIQFYNHQLKKNIKGMTEGAMEICKAHEWKGNVRELKNVIERIMIFQENEWIGVEDLPHNILSDKNIFHDKNIGGIGNSMNLETVEMETISRVLKQNNWNISRTAQELGISRLTLRRKIEKYSLTK
ncbi:sigma-54-dependent transcriptional regulator [Thermotalea metallivorans]|uniref:Stage 0 sporulation protein A homolog n=1 Tax=Thermotalea metallivorans TaxID=520762 RepID=A0A140L9H1_9FIRM|nr:sigma-54 dependent transcriptional regulator [Thermotalea metallivorans]KXG77196.1 Transcriptional regulatory protein ZraR [Thermotalea metallivorans]